MFKKISVAEAKELLNQDNVVCFDVRDEAAYQNGHIENAKHLTRSNFTECCQSLMKEIPILVYCYKGMSSQAIAQMLVQQGFQNVYSMDGGFEAWKK